MSKTKVKFISIIIALSSIFLCAVNVNAVSDFEYSEDIDEYVNKQMKAADIPGLSLGIVKDDKIVYLKGYGKADETNRLVSPQTPFMIGSITKSFTGLAIMQLVNEGKIELDKPVRDYITWFQLSDIEASKHITIRNLLEHRSGISMKAAYEYELFNDKYDLVQAVQMFKRVKTNRPVGGTSEYSNINYIILGLVIQTVSGQSYEEYLKNNILDPLQMKNSYCTESEALDNGLAKGYQHFYGFVLPRSAPHSKALLPAGNLITCSEDMAHFMIAYLNNGKYNNSYITKESNSIANQETSVNSLNHDIYWVPRDRYYLSNGYPEFAGGAFNYSSDMLIVPKEKWGVIVLSNINTGTLSPTTIGPISIANGIVKQFLVPQEYQPAVNNINKIYLVLDLVILIIILLFALQIRNFIKKRNTFFRSRIRISKYLIVLTVINFFIPLVILFGFPRLINNEHPTWAMITLGLPDIAYFCIIASGLYLTMGILKTIHIFVFLRTSHLKKSLQASKDVSN